MRLPYLLPPLRRWRHRRQAAGQRARREQAARHNAAVARILAQAPRIRDPWRSYR